jgi:hypothetical protein
LRPDRRGDRKGRNDRDAIQEMLHASYPLWQFRIGEIRCNGSLNLRATLAGLGPETTIMVLRSREYATSGVAYPISPVLDNMIRAAEFQAFG